MIFERRAWFIVDAAILVLLLVSLRLVYWQMIRGSELLPVGLLAGVAGQDHLNNSIDDNQGIKELLQGQGSLDNPEELPQPALQRLTDFFSTITRGSIYDRNGNILAEDRLDSQGNQIRFYTQPGLAHTLGYVSGLRVGVSGLEKRYNQVLLGLDQPEASFDRMLHQPITGSNLVLTIDGRLQRAAEDALEGRAGSIIVMDAHSGAILAMASLPGYDPNRILEPGYLASQEDACAGAPHCSGILLNRATQGLYTPGSTWKTVTLIAALDSGQVSPDMVFDFGEPVQSPDGPYYVYRVGGGVITDPNHRENRLSLELSYAKSANAAFARIGDEMPAQVLMDYAGRFGFAAPGSAQPAAMFPLEMAYSQGQLVSDSKELVQNDLLRAATAIGQGELLSTPLNMGMVVLAVMNDGNLPLPYLVEKVYTPSGVAAAHQPQRAHITGLMKPETAQIVRRMMTTVVTQGSGKKAAVEGLTVGGKTGTAQVGGDLAPHAWFIGFAQKADQAVVIVVQIENGGEGSQVAAPVFARMAQAVFIPQNRPEPAVTLPPPTQTPQPTPQPTAKAITRAATPDSQPESPVPTPTPTPVVAGVPPPDIPYRDDRTDFTEMGSATCPGNQVGPVGDGKFIWPSVYQAVSGEKFSESHPGVDFSTPPGVPVYAADDGLVIFAGWSELGYGNVIVIDHGNGYKTLYAHLSQISQYCGAKVKSGQLIGLSGSTGNSSGPHLHFEVRVPGGYLNPLKVLPTP
jgi:peptidoglycan glycosyltransferase